MQITRYIENSGYSCVFIYYGAKKDKYVFPNKFYLITPNKEKLLKIYNVCLPSMIIIVSDQEPISALSNSIDIIVRRNDNKSYIVYNGKEKKRVANLLHETILTSLQSQF